jgi:hypothetical protein
MSNKILPSAGSRWLVIGGWLSLTASALHIACIMGGPDWYRFFGAGEALAQADARGSWVPAIMAFGIATILALWAAFAFSGAGRIKRLPLLRTGLVVISAIYLARGLLLIPLHLMRPQLTDSFAIWSSLIVFIYGVAYAVGTWRAWRSMTPVAKP